MHTYAPVKDFDGMGEGHFGTDWRWGDWPCGLTSDLGILLVKPLHQPDFAPHTGDDAQVIQPLRHLSSRRWPTLHTRFALRLASLYSPKNVKRSCEKWESVQISALTVADRRFERAGG
jgi:hypothetical protein